VSDILGAAGWEGGVVTRDGLDWLRDRLLAARLSDKLRMDGLKEDRRPVIGGGLSVLRAVFDLFGIQAMHAAQGALRHGVLYDLLDREHGETDLRSATVQRLALKFDVDAAQADRVARVSCHLLGMLRDAGQALPDAARPETKLAWAARLHEIGSVISHSDYHRHGAYILDNADAPGFAQPELHRLSMLVLGHRGKLRKLEGAFTDATFVKQLLCIRLAVILCHARREPDLGGLRLSLAGRAFTLALPATWLDSYPQSAYLLREEVAAWQKTDWSLQLG
jgi:exopolyphosphatase/guanosine-5'-triphosphate,3'-diphosphate pyrophosphatase